MSEKQKELFDRLDEVPAAARDKVEGFSICLMLLGDILTEKKVKE